MRDSIVFSDGKCEQEYDTMPSILASNRFLCRCTGKSTPAAPATVSAVSGSHVALVCDCLGSKTNLSEPP